MNSINFHFLPSQSSLFLDYLSGQLDPFLLNETKLLSSEFLESCLNRQFDRESIKNVITNSSGSNLSDTQKNNLELVSAPKTFFIITGQQSGFLGGPIYTLLKAISAVALAAKLNIKHSDCKFVPIFWIEDNDHDAKEASTVFIQDKLNHHLEIHLAQDESGRIPTAERMIGSDIESVLDIIAEQLPSSEFRNEAIEKLKEIYFVGKTWTEAFVEFMNWIIGFSGILYVSASELRKSGTFRDIIISELERPGYSESLIHSTNSKLESLGYKIQAKPSSVNLFIHNHSGRHSIDFADGMFSANGEHLSREQMIELAEKSPERFSPKVLLRPIIQDTVLPTAAYIGGPGEIAYLAQLNELYKGWNLQMPVVLPRISATFIDKKTNKNLTKVGKELTYFLKPWQEIERELASSLTDENTKQSFESSKERLADIYSNLKSISSAIDASLERTADGYLHKSNEMIDTLLKKTESAIKKSNSETLERFKQIHNSVYPNSHFQERYYSILNIINSLGISAVRALLLDVSGLDAKEHKVVEM